MHYDVVDGEIVPNVEERGKEPQNRFYNMTVDGESLPLGMYELGVNFGQPLDWSNYDTTGEIKTIMDAKVMDSVYYDLINQALGYMKLSTSRLTNVTAYPSTMNTKSGKVADTAITFVNNAIIGNRNLTSDWNAMLNQCVIDGYNDVVTIIRATSVELGIIAS